MSRGYKGDNSSSVSRSRSRSRSRSVVRSEGGGGIGNEDGAKIDVPANLKNSDPNQREQKDRSVSRSRSGSGSKSASKSRSRSKPKEEDAHNCCTCNDEHEHEHEQEHEHDSEHDPDDPIHPQSNFIDFITSMEQILCITDNLKIAMVNDFMQNSCNPTINTIKLTQQLCFNLSSNPFIGYRNDMSGHPVKYYLFPEPLYYNKNLKHGRPLSSKEIVAVDSCNRQYSIWLLSYPHTEYIPEPSSVCEPNITYLNAVNSFEEFVQNGMKLVNSL